MAELELEVGDDRDEVGVAAALAVAVDRALDQRGALGDGGERVGHAALGVVVAVDAERARAERARDRAHRLGDLVGSEAPLVSHSVTFSAPAVGGRAQAARARSPGRRASRRRSARRRRRPACPAPTRKATESAIIAQVLLAVDADDLLEVQRPGLADERADRREGARRAPAAPGRRRRAGRAGGSSRTRAIVGVQNVSRASSAKSSASFGFEAGKPASIEVDAELVEHVRDAHLLLGRERHALALHAVAQGGVVDRRSRLTERAPAAGTTSSQSA